jgi:hypothetical protein
MALYRIHRTLTGLVGAKSGRRWHLVTEGAVLDCEPGDLKHLPRGSYSRIHTPPAQNQRA